MSSHFPERIICLTEETTEIIYLLNASEKIVGISGFTVRPPIARKTKPKVCTFIDADYQKIEMLKPDLILAFSDIQAEIAKELIKRGFNVYTSNIRSVEDILQNILIVGSLIGKQKSTERLVKTFEKKLTHTKKLSAKIKIKPKVFFEEWDQPLISCIRWVSELIEIAGGEEIFTELREKKLAKDRIVHSNEVIIRNPDIIIGSWCGKGFKKEIVKGREGWSEINAVKNNLLFEIKSSIILQPGPAALSEGLDNLIKILKNFN